MKITFLNGYLEKAIYMAQLEGLLFEGEEKKVFKFKIFIYGHHQVSRSWKMRFDVIIKSDGFDQNDDEPCMYKLIKDKKVVFLMLMCMTF